MPQLLLLIQKALIGAGTVLVAAIITAVDFTNSVTLGSIVTSVLVLVVAGVLTIRSKVATIWREEAEGERAAKERAQEELKAERINHTEFEKQQIELRHELKNQLAGVRAQLEVIQAKTDLTAAIETIQHMNETSVASIIDSISEAIAQRDARTHELLTEIRDKLPAEPIAVLDVGTGGEVKE